MSREKGRSQKAKRFGKKRSQIKVVNEWDIACNPKNPEDFYSSEVHGSFVPNITKEKSEQLLSV